MSTTPRPRLDAPVDPFRLNPADSGEPVGLDDLITSGPVVLVLVEGGRADDPRAAMLRELGERIASSPARLVLVSPGDSDLCRSLSVVRTAEWLTDPKGDASRALGTLSDRRMRKARRQDGLFVVDQARVLRFAFRVQEKNQWIPASFVWSRLSRLGSAAPPPSPAEHTADPVAPGEAELDILVREVGRRMGLSSNELTQLATASRFRDLGMSVVPDEIITKMGPLSDEEWAIVREHPQRSAEMLGTSPLFDNVRAIVQGSHEHVDGSGYPNGLRGDEIPLGSRILLAAEAYLAMVFGRRYHDGERPLNPIAELEKGVGSRYDAGVVETLAAAVEHLDLRPDAQAA
ncbi:MAG TPA: HD domain-containing phosphohydrolase [Gaiellales bacterium]|nr:HD domain-containing phosphohydrolase [Gaiellales bacterium]